MSKTPLYFAFGKHHGKYDADGVFFAQAINPYLQERVKIGGRKVSL